MGNKHLLFFLFFFLGSLFLLGLIIEGPESALKGFLYIQTHPARLINDYIETAGMGGAMVNAALVGAMGFALIALTKVILSGPTFAAVMTMTGFGLFGKTPLNILPIILGVYLAALLVKKRMKDYLIIALFGTALGPLVSALAWELGFQPWIALPLALLGGLVTGFFLPPIAVSMLHLHQGYNLYNMGLSCGFFGLFAAAIIRGFGHQYQGQMSWYQGDSLFLTLMIPVLSLIMIIWAFIAGGGKTLKRFWEIQKIPGRLPSDFIDMVSTGGAFLNSGLVGLIASTYLWLIGASFNGPVIGGLLTIMGFAAFGTTLKNSWPVATGVVAATLATGNSLNAPGPVLAFIFGTTLGPLAGEFGIPVGLAAGVIHFLMVMQTGAWSGGMNLYNNGFAGGLTAALIVSVIQWYRTNRAQF
ncbi:MAG: DUF1576 domain-containing protein [Spirochaetaceae bacterium]|jgi:hypothetical protein|nr:DUF1576 domain-containing protein [Spirochaetaceae bacterium]